MASPSGSIPMRPVADLERAEWTCDDEASFNERVAGANKDLAQVTLKGRLKAIPDTIGQLTALQTLDLHECKALESLASLAGLTALKTLSGCSALQSLPPLAGLTALQTLDLRECKALTSLESLDGLTALQTLNLKGCEALESLPPLDGLIALQKLDLMGCKALESLPSLAGLTALQTLNLEECEALESLPSLAGLTALQTLDLGLCNALTSLPPLAGLAALQTLILWGCEALESLPPLAGLTALQRLDLGWCKRLKSLPPLAGLAALQTLNLQRCDSLTSLPPLDGLAELQTLKLNGCYALESLPPLDGLTALQTLDLGWCKALKSLPPLAGLTALQTLFLMRCEALKSLPDSIGQLTALTNLDLRGCISLQQLPPSVACLMAVKRSSVRFVLVGRTGSGKSVTGNVLRGIEDPDDTDDADPEAPDAPFLVSDRMQSFTQEVCARQAQGVPGWIDSMCVVDTIGLGDQTATPTCGETPEQNRDRKTNNNARSTQAFDDITNDLNASGGTVLFVCRDTALSAGLCKHLQALEMVSHHAFGMGVILVLTCVPPVSDQDGRYADWLGGSQNKIQANYQQLTQSSIEFRAVLGLSMERGLDESHPAHPLRFRESVLKLSQVACIPAGVVKPWREVLNGTTERHHAQLQEALAKVKERATSYGGRTVERWALNFDAPVSKAESELKRLSLAGVVNSAQLRWMGDRSSSDYLRRLVSMLEDPTRRRPEYWKHAKDLVYE